MPPPYELGTCEPCVLLVYELVPLVSRSYSFAPSHRRQLQHHVDSCSQLRRSDDAVCANANLPVNGTKANYLKALRESGAALGSSQTLSDIKERFAALTWVRHAVANAIDPAMWPATLSAPLLDFLQSLYPIQPQRSDAPVGESDLHRLAHMVSLFLPADLSAASTTAAPTLPINPGGGINTTRPQAAQQASASASTASSALPQPALTFINLTGKKRWMMHDELHALLPDAVYTLP